MSGQNKCTADAVCKTFDEKMNDPYTKSKGFRFVHTLNMETGSTRLLGVAYHTSSADKGLMVNTCPWCGGQPGYFERL